MQSYGFFKLTYRIIKFNQDPKFQICKIRLYSIPSDIEGARFFRDWRQMLKASLKIDKNYIINLDILLKYVDFSSSGWKSNLKMSISEFLHNHDLIFIIDAQKLVKLSIPPIEESKFYIQRWCSGGSVGRYSISTESLDTSFGQRVKDIYNEIRSPNLSKYVHDDIDMKEVTQISSIELRLSKLAMDATKDSVKIPGVKSLVYPYQARSLGVMLERESTVRRSLVPNFIKLKSPISMTEFYFDLYTKQICTKPSLVTLPKGGILAENMGLGKTLICLGLICLTKFEISKIPLDLLLYHEIEIQDSVKSLTKLCREKVAQSSIPWQYYNLPESLKQDLKENPGYFCMQHDIDESFNSAVQPRKRSNNNKNSATLRKLYMCSTSLVVVPDNLFSQWSDEIAKHVDEGYLKVLCLANHIKTRTIQIM